VTRIVRQYPRRKSDAVDEFFRGQKPDNAIIVKANYSDNPFFPAVLEEEMQLDRERYPDRFAHAWLGDYARAFEGAYYAQVLTQAGQEGRIGTVSADPILTIKLFWDIGGAGAKADACAIWVTQFAGQEIRVLDYIEADLTRRSARRELKRSASITRRRTSGAVLA
jgi:phage terminase large subunit